MILLNRTTMCRALSDSRDSLLILSLGMVAIVGYAPFYFYPAPVLTLAALFYSWQTASGAKQAAWRGYLFGLGFFCTGVSWIYVSLHDFGGMPVLMAALATFAFCAFLALFPAVAGWLTKKTGTPLLAAPLVWMLIEWLRSWIFTGFPWLNVGYSQVPYSPLAGFAPVVGIYGISLLVTLAASILLLARHKTTRRKAIITLVALWITGSLLKFIDWSKPSGVPVSVALLQGNIAQDMKWQPEIARQTLNQYLRMIQSTHAKLIVLPETALPLVISEVPADYLQQIKTLARRNGGDILVGAVEAENDRYYNSMLSIGNAPSQTYRKSHLVPFGEFIPFKAAINWIYEDWLHMPLSDLSRGVLSQQPLSVAGEQVAVNICYEDVFGEEIIRQLPQATLLVNASNMAWYGQSWAAAQQLQMSQTRALETGRMMLRATNTGVTAIIDPHGNLLAQLPQFLTATLEGQVQGYAGATPYVRLGNWPVIVFCFAVLAILWRRKLLSLPKKK